LDIIYHKIAELYDIIEEWDFNFNDIDSCAFVLEELANIQNYCK
jgi:hypothetical protein